MSEVVMILTDDLKTGFKHLSFGKLAPNSASDLDSESDNEITGTDEEKLAAISFELNQIDTEIRKLNKRKSELIELREQLTDKALLKKSKILADKDWDRTDFPWYDKLMNVLNNVFKIKELRTYQLPTMNATLSGHHVILIMPTGGGKSLCYQLPALVDKGITLVISPLVALMEDQVMALRNLNVDVGMFHADCDKAEANRLMQAMTDKNSQLKLIYLTPEKLAKSKRFMSKLQKCYEMGRLSRIAIDEVHCCSQWGHDFRPDYKFLGVLNSMFSEVPILGLTATATTKVTVDVQKMLDIQGCMTFKASFNRPNLYYEVRPKPTSLKDCVDELEDLMKHRFANKSGIIYTTTIKDCSDLRNELRQRGLKVSGYHANLDPNQRSSVHRKWISGEYQAVVATIAFGLGIDKPDVRFVIHHALSKSMENFYQESGRAGRDGNPADCILFYRLGDVFKLSPMVFSQQTGLKCLYGIVEYCLDVHRCRRLMIASHFDESWESTDCKSMCDHCRNPRQPKEVDITKHCQSVYKLIANGAKSDTKLTAQKLLEAWYGKGPAQLRSPDVSAPSFARDTGEAIIAYLIIKDYLKEDFHFTPYSTISYLRRGNMAATLNDPKHQIAMTIRGKAMSLDNTSETLDRSSKSLAKVKTVSKKDLREKLNTSESASEVVVVKSNLKRQRSENSGPQVSKRKVVLIESDSE